jgi:hypothetical protein
VCRSVRVACGLLAPLLVDPGLQRCALLTLAEVLQAFEGETDHEQRTEQE